jgi:hypothetical protein
MKKAVIVHIIAFSSSHHILTGANVADSGEKTTPRKSWESSAKFYFFRGCHPDG